MGGENKKDRSQTRTEALCLQIRQFHTDSCCLHLYIQSHQSKGQRGGVAKRKRNQPNGPGARVKTRSNDTRLDDNIYRRETGEKRLSSAKRKNTTKGFVTGRNALQQISTHVAGGVQKRIPIPGQVSGTAQHIPFNWSLY